MYTLVCGTMSGDVSKKKDLCFAMADELVRDCLGGDEKRSSLRPDESELSIRTGVCHCLIDLLYPGPDADDEYLLFLKRQIAGWIAEMNRDGSWNGVSPDVALERVGVMNRYSCMLLDRTNDKAVKRSFEYFRNSLPVPEDTGNFDENYLRTLGLLYDAALLGNAYDVDRRLARRTARFMYDYSRMLPERNDAWLYCSSYVIHYIAEGIEARLEAEIERHIA